jgi:hypothetical protein
MCVLAGELYMFFSFYMLSPMLALNVYESTLIALGLEGVVLLWIRTRAPKTVKQYPPAYIRWVSWYWLNVGLACTAFTLIFGDFSIIETQPFMQIWVGGTIVIALMISAWQARTSRMH